MKILSWLFPPRLPRVESVREKARLVGDFDDIPESGIVGPAKRKPYRNGIERYFAQLAQSGSIKVLSLLLLVLSLATVVAASPYTAYSVTNVQRIADNVYTATVSISKTPSDVETIFTDGNVVRIKTIGCSHIPAKGASGIILNGPDARALIFSDSGTCEIAEVTSN